MISSQLSQLHYFIFPDSYCIRKTYFYYDSRITIGRETSSRILIYHKIGNNSSVIKFLEAMK